MVKKKIKRKFYTIFSARPQSGTTNTLQLFGRMNRKNVHSLSAQKGIVLSDSKATLKRQIIKFNKRKDTLVRVL